MTTQQARRTRRAIVTAAHDLFLAQGYAATTIDGITEAAHVSRRVDCTKSPWLLTADFFAA